jgi:dTDP-4-amino-4,6-dideoxygalactose transaminase
MESIPFNNLKPIHGQLKSEMVSAFEHVYDGGQFILGKQLELFEKRFAAFCKTSYCIGVSNGLDALRICLKTLKIGQGDEVILPANGYMATVLAVIQAGARPVFVDAGEEDYNLDVSRIESAITSSTKAIIPVHLYGQPADMPELITVTEKHSLRIIEDNAQAHGASIMEKPTGSWGHLNATSFYPTKNLGALGDAGAVTSDDAEIAEKVKVLRNYGSAAKYQFIEKGFNMRLDECQAAFLNVKLNYLLKWTESRREIASWYNEELSVIPQIKIPVTKPGFYHVFHLYVIQVPERDKFRAYLLNEGIETMIHYPKALHNEQILAEYVKKGTSFPVAELLSKTCVSLPLWIGMDRQQVTRIAEKIKKFFQ